MNPRTAKTQPQKTLSVFDAASIIVGVIVGVGIYETSPLIAQSLAHRTSLYAVWILGGLLSLAGALCYAELSAAFPKIGGDYHFLRKAYGPLFGFLFSWGRTVIIRPGSIAAMAFPFATYFREACGPGLTGYPTTIIAIAAVLVLTIVNILGVKGGVRTQNVLTLLKVLGILALVTTAFFAEGPQLTNEPVLDVDLPGRFGLALILVLFCYGGWNEIAYVAAEVKDPDKNLARAIFWGTALTMLIYLLLIWAFESVLGFPGLQASSAPASDLIARILPEYGPRCISVLICLSTLSAINALILTGGRISYALGLDVRPLSFLAQWNRRLGTPVHALLTQGALSVAIIAFTGSFSGAVVYTTGVVWIFFFLSALSLIVLRKRFPGLRRPYTVPLYPLSPLVFCAMSLYLVYSAVVYDWYGTCVSLGILFAGIPMFRFYRLSQISNPADDTEN